MIEIRITTRGGHFVATAYDVTGPGRPSVPLCARVGSTEEVAVERCRMRLLQKGVRPEGVPVVPRPPCPIPTLGQKPIRRRRSSFLVLAPRPLEASHDAADS